MNSQQRQLIRGLIKHYSGSGTESFIAYVAETNCMLAACQALLQSLEEADPTSTLWLQRECSDKNLIFHAFLQEVQQTVALFRPNHLNEDHHATLGVSVNAGPEEIKHAYRILSRRYHPDTAAPPDRNNPEQFIAINKAYQALMKSDGKGESDVNMSQKKQWRSRKVRGVSPEQRKKVAIWTLGLLIVLAVVSIFASMSYKKRAMLAGLQQSRGAFIPPSRKIFADSGGQDFKRVNPPTARPSVTTETIKTPTQDFVVKIQEDPKASHPLTAQATGAAPPPSTALVNIEIVADNTPKPVISTPPSPRPAKTAAHELGNHVSRRQAGVADKVEKTDDKTIAQISENITAPPAVSAESPATSQPVHSTEIPAPRQEEIKSLTPAEIFNTVIPEATATASEDRPTQQEELARAIVLPADLPTIAPSSVPAEDHQKKPEADMQTRIDRFLANYFNAYQQRNPVLFARFFDAAAEENGKKFASILPTYLELFATTRLVSLQVDQRTWRVVDGLVAVNGRFTVDLQYTDGRKIAGSGPIHFVLVENGGEILIKKMDYVFNAE